MQSNSTVAPIEHELITPAGHVVGAHYPEPDGANGDANSTTSDNGDDYITPSDVNDDSGSSGDESEPEIKALERERDRYVPRTKPSKPAVGAQVAGPPPAQNNASNTGSQSSGKKKGRPVAVTANGKTTASLAKKKANASTPN